MYILEQSDLYLSIFAAFMFLCSVLVASSITKNSSLSLKLFLSLYFVQYFLTIIVVSLNGYWSAFVLSPQEISSALQYALFCAISVIAGYIIYSALERLFFYRTRTDLQNIYNKPFVGFRFHYRYPRRSDWRKSYLLIFAVIVIMALEAFMFEGGISYIFISSLSRGSGQFENKNVFETFVSVLFFLNGILGIAAALFLGRALGMSRGLNMVALTPFALFLLVLCASPLMHSFSRASGGAFIVAAISLILSPRRSSLKLILILIFFALGLYFCVIGITQRGIAPMGVLSFIQSAMSPDPAGFDYFMTLSSAGNWVLGPNVNFFDALGPLSASMHFSGSFDKGVLQGFAWLAAILQPLPGFVIPIDYRPGASLSLALGTWGSTGITSPAIAELYFLVGYWGFIPLLAYGAFLRKVDKMLSINTKLPLVVFLFVLAGVVISGHSGIRAFARPTILAVLLVFAFGKKFSLGSLTIDLRSKA